MKAICVIESMRENPYFATKAKRLFSEISYLHERPKADQLIECLGKCDVLIIGLREKISAEMIQRSTSLPRVIGTLSIGLDHLDTKALAERGVMVINTPTANVVSVAEHIIGFALALAKRFKESNAANDAGMGRKGVSKLPMELLGKTFGLVGYGKIAARVGSFAHCLGMEVIATSQSKRDGKSDFVQFVTLDELFRRSDIVSLSVPLTPETQGLIGRTVLANSKRGLFLINTSRPVTVDHDAIIEALDAGVLGGYAEDAEPVPERLSKRLDVIATPHLAGLTVEANDRLDNELIDRIEAYLTSK